VLLCLLLSQIRRLLEWRLPQLEQQHGQQLDSQLREVRDQRVRNDQMAKDLRCMQAAFDNLVELQRKSCAAAQAEGAPGARRAAAAVRTLAGIVSSQADAFHDLMLPDLKEAKEQQDQLPPVAALPEALSDNAPTLRAQLAAARQDVLAAEQRAQAAEQQAAARQAAEQRAQAAELRAHAAEQRELAAGAAGQRAQAAEERAREAEERAQASTADMQTMKARAEAAERQLEQQQGQGQALLARAGAAERQLEQQQGQGQALLARAEAAERQLEQQRARAEAAEEELRAQRQATIRIAQEEADIAAGVPEPVGWGALKAAASQAPQQWAGLRNDTQLAVSLGGSGGSQPCSGARAPRHHPQQGSGGVGATPQG
jgi:hypothetical protein